MRIILLFALLLFAIGCNAPVEKRVSTLEQTTSKTNAIIANTPTTTTLEADLTETTVAATQVPTLSATATETPMPTATSLAATLPIIQAAPEIANEVWLNSNPMKLSDLRGKVVLVEFWTFG